MNREQRILSMQARELLKTHSELLLSVAEKIEKETHVPIHATTAFEYAKAYIRQEAIKEGVTLFLRKLNTLANDKETN